MAARVAAFFGLWAWAFVCIPEEGNFCCSRVGLGRALGAEQRCCMCLHSEGTGQMSLISSNSQARTGNRAKSCAIWYLGRRFQRSLCIGSPMRGGLVDLFFLKKIPGRASECWMQSTQETAFGKLDPTNWQSRLAVPYPGERMGGRLCLARCCSDFLLGSFRPVV